MFAFEFPTGTGLHPDLQVTHFNGTGRHVVDPQVEGAAAREIEAGVVPVAGMPSSTLPRSSGKPMCGQRLSNAKTRPRSWTRRYFGQFNTGDKHQTRKQRMGHHQRCPPVAILRP
jgi:hypothetical protein